MIGTFFHCPKLVIEPSMRYIFSPSFAHAEDGSQTTCVSGASKAAPGRGNGGRTMPQYERQERISLAFEILKECADNRTTITYGDLGGRIGLEAQEVSDDCLNPIYWYCEAQQWPHLPVLAVYAVPRAPRKPHVRGGVPGLGYPGPRERILVDAHNVFQHDWSNANPPDPWPV